MKRLLTFTLLAVLLFSRPALATSKIDSLDHPAIDDIDWAEAGDISDLIVEEDFNQPLSPDKARGIQFDYLQYRIRANRRYGDGADSDRARYLGDDWGLTQRLQVRGTSSKFNTISFSAMADKDRYELNVADLHRWSLDLHDANLRIIIGDFDVSSGQGLTLRTKPQYYSSYADRSTYSQSGMFIQPAMGAVENSSLRGGGLSIHGRMTDVTVFISATELDAIVDNNGGVLRLSDGGLHRSDGELEKRNSITEIMAGAVVRTKLVDDADGHLALEGVGYISDFNSELIQNAGLDVDQRILYPMQGSVFHGYGGSMDLRYYLVYFNTEIGYDQDYNLARQLGIGLRSDRISPLNANLTLYDYPAEYYNYRASAPKSGTGMANRRGVALLLGYRNPLAWVERAKAHFEYEQRPERSYTIPEPSSSLKGSFEATTPIGVRDEVQWRYIYAERDDGHGETAPVTREKDNRVRMLFRHRTEASYIDRVDLFSEVIQRRETGEPTNYGVLAGTRIALDLMPQSKHSMRTNLALTWFNTAGGVPLYLGEASLPDRFASVYLSGNGLRWSASVTGRFSRQSWLGLEACRTERFKGEKSSDLEVYLTMSWRYSPLQR